jgi:hypothetical protein
MNTTIRNYLYDRLLTTSTFTAANTFKGRYIGENVNESDLPIAMILFLQEDRERISMGPSHTFEHEAQWQIRVLATGQVIDTALDGYQDEIEAALDDRTMDGAVMDSYIISVAYSHNSEGEADFGELAITLAVTYTA